MLQRISVDVDIFFLDRVTRAQTDVRPVSHERPTELLRTALLQNTARWSGLSLHDILPPVCLTS